MMLSMSGSWGMWFFALVGALCVATASPRALAQTADDALRRDLVAQAETAREAGDHARALDLATRAAQLRATPSLGLMIAQEHEQLGHIVDALDHARRCASDASRDGTLRNRERITRNCRDLAAALATQVARVTVRVPADDDGASIRIGSQSIPPAGWGVPIPVDPGDVIVRGSHRDGRSFERTIRVARGGSVTIDVVLALRAPTTVNVAPMPAITPPAPETPSPLEGPRTTAAATGPGAGPWVLAGAGAASLIVAGVLWSMHDGAIADRDAACDPRGCAPSSIEFNETARSLTLGTNIALGLGAAAIAGGLTWFFVARSGRGETRALRPSAWMHPGGAGLSLEGAL